MTAVMPAWAAEMRAAFRAEASNQFVLYGNVHDPVEHRGGDGTTFLPLQLFLRDVLFQPFDVVLFYDRGKGIRAAKGGERFFDFLSRFDRFHGSRFAADGGAAGDPQRALDSPGLLPRAPSQALELINRFVAEVARQGGRDRAPLSLAVVVEYAEFIVPRGESLYMSGEIGDNLIRILHWGEDPGIAGANIVTLLLSENLLDLSAAVTESPSSVKVRIPLPDREALRDYLGWLVRDEAGFARLCGTGPEALADKLVGLSRLNVRSLVLRALRNDQPLTGKFLSNLKRELIEKEAGDKLQFIESKRTLDDVAGHEEAKTWLREDARLLHKGATRALPMGYLITGRIGTGKTYLVECFAGECGVPFVELRNFREKWVGATEGNLEKILSILHALGQVVVFVDEADQATGRRGGGEGDSGLSGRIYAMLAREMADTANRGRILWIFATSRPDLLEVDLKRQGRLDVHIPLFPPAAEGEKRALFLAMARKLGLGLKEEEIPPLPFREPVSGNELEGLLVRALRRFELQPEGGEKKTLAQIVRETAAGFRPSAHTAALERMDLLAVLECTDERFLPDRFRSLSGQQIEERLAALSG